MNRHEGYEVFEHLLATGLLSEFAKLLVEARDLRDAESTWEVTNRMIGTLAPVGPGWEPFDTDGAYIIYRKRIPKEVTA